MWSRPRGNLVTPLLLVLPRRNGEKQIEYLTVPPVVGEIDTVKIVGVGVDTPTRTRKMEVRKSVAKGPVMGVDGRRGRGRGRGPGLEEWCDLS